MKNIYTNRRRLLATFGILAGGGFLPAGKVLAENKKPRCKDVAEKSGYKNMSSFETELRGSVRATSEPDKVYEIVDDGNKLLGVKYYLVLDYHSMLRLRVEVDHQGKALPKIIELHSSDMRVRFESKYGYEMHPLRKGPRYEEIYLADEQFLAELANFTVAMKDKRQTESGEQVRKDVEEALKRFEPIRRQWQGKFLKALADAGYSKNPDMCSRSSEGCYLTTAAVGVVGLPDDCWELATLRAFRDEVLAKTNQGRALIADYYALAPCIVAAIDRRPDAPRIWRKTWGLGIVPAALCAHLGLNRVAVHLYKSMTRRLQRLAGM
jgi:hypothetical protein